MRGGPHICYSSVRIPLVQRSSRHTTEIHVQYSTASLTAWLCRICLRHNVKYLQIYTLLLLRQ
ncbi:MAG: hypothetical protein ACK55Z_08925, partial [bacterium]